MTPILETKELCKFYGSGDSLVKAVDHVNIQISRGEFVAIVGKSGSGKSTDGEHIAGLSEAELALLRRRKTGVIFQAYNLIPSLNVRENIVLPLGLDNRKADEAFILDILKTLDMEEKINALPNTLSGGQQQRTAIARAIAAKPSIILADEPTGNLDSRTGDEVISLLKLSAKKYGQTLVVITHNEDIAQMADRTLILEDGRIVNA